jgi:hypothetical protein
MKGGNGMGNIEERIDPKSRNYKTYPPCSTTLDELYRTRDQIASVS